MNNKWKIDNNDLVLFLLIVLMFLSMKDTITFNILKIVVYSIICFYSFFIAKVKLDKKRIILYSFLSITCIISCIINCNFIKYFNLIAQILSMDLLLNNQKQDIRLNNITCFLICVLCLIQMLIFHKTSGRSFLLSAGDPNYSGYYIFLWVILLYKKDKKFFSVLLSIIGLFTISRNYLICVFLFYLLNKKRVNDFFSKVLSIAKYSFFRICLVLIVFISAFSIIYVKNNNWNLETYNESSYTSRFFALKDDSNYARFYANVVYFNQLKDNFSEYILGFDEQYYTSHIYIYPHNAFLLGSLKYGISFVLYFLCLCSLFTKKVVKSNIDIFIPLFIYYTFLGLGMIGIENILLAYNLKITETGE